MNDTAPSQGPRIYRLRGIGRISDKQHSSHRYSHRPCEVWDKPRPLPADIPQKVVTDALLSHLCALRQSQGLIVYC